MTQIGAVTKPPRLFKYQRYDDQSLDNLEKRQVWFSSPANFNDPFDCGVLLRITEPTETDLRRLLDKWPARAGPRPDGPPYVSKDGRPTDALRGEMMNAGERAMRARVAENYWRKGMCCFSASRSAYPDNLLLWSHYGGGHKGFCLEFDTRADMFEKVHAVRYVPRIPEWDVVRTFLELDDESFLDMVLARVGNGTTSWSGEWCILSRTEPSATMTH